ncbi:aminotransferase class I/II-fold pyridoxal phosphate-dependent enzyme [Pedobacter psychroterrae]|uniref:Aminotransferase class I/II-fold pyridoxal phosphate-dependent enzyme n=1 Tax=Pedobacter psychroterrae TaxID=2530453 RepID=A0A4R0NQR9_9SPHI|nr:aminotransferase class I/II-fold pyridoxal phosphate-dependent enzyme [Pedobacter psychroterrae]TCD03156.1 aminotransferase class I/II-fold pyridoxal phosphate-dependent enzyme [Pedobacter psychroterrae]
MNVDFENASFKDFENPEGMDIYQRSDLFNEYLDFLQDRGHLNYRLESLTGCGPVVEMDIPGYGGRRPYVSLVSNDYLGFSQHPLVKKAAVYGINNFGTGAGASPAIGGHYSFHQELENAIASFFKRDSAIIYTTGYTANSASLLSMLQVQDLAILDIGVHTSVREGCSATNTKIFLHNNLNMLERILRENKDKYRTKMVVIDGVYSQDGDLAPLDQILQLTKHYGAYLMLDDAHGTGVIGETGRGVIETHDLFEQVDIISGTFSKTFAHVGGYVIASAELVRFLKFQSRQHLFSATSTPACMAITKAIQLIDQEPEWMDLLWENINYFTTGLRSLGLDIGTTASAIIPVKIGNSAVTGEVSKMLLKAGVYANPIIYPAVPKKHSRIRMSLMATHTRPQLDAVLNAFEHISNKLGLTKT